MRSPPSAQRHRTQSHKQAAEGLPAAVLQRAPSPANLRSVSSIREEWEAKAVPDAAWAKSVNYAAPTPATHSRLGEPRSATAAATLSPDSDPQADIPDALHSKIDPTQHAMPPKAYNNAAFKAFSSPQDDAADAQEVEDEEPPEEVAMLDNVPDWMDATSPVETAVLRGEARLHRESDDMDVTAHEPV